MGAQSIRVSSVQMTVSDLESPFSRHILYRHVRTSI